MALLQTRIVVKLPLSMKHSAAELVGIDWEIAESTLFLVLLTLTACCPKHFAFHQKSI